MPGGFLGGGGTGGSGMPGGTGGGFGPFLGGGGEGQLKQETDFPSEPTKATMYTYVPKSFKKGNPIVVALHHCGGTGPGFFQETSDWAKAADQKGFMMIYPTSPPDSSKCWDVSKVSNFSASRAVDKTSLNVMLTPPFFSCCCCFLTIDLPTLKTSTTLTQQFGSLS